MELMRVEGFGQFVEEAVSVFRRCADQGVADDDAELAVDAPVDEEAEALIAKPLQPLRLVERAHFRIVLSRETCRSAQKAGDEEEHQQRHDTE